MTPSLTLFFIVEPPTYQYLACYLAASIRNHFPSDVTIIGYCPEHKLKEIHPAVIETLRRLRCEVRGFKSIDRFEPAYPHGNKLLACLEPRDTDFSGFIDSDVLIVKGVRIEDFVKEGHVSASPAASLRWGSDTLWPTIYSTFGMDVPKDRIWLMRDKRRQVPPYFSSGFVIFPEKHRTSEGLSFPQVWFNSAQRIDAISGLENRRPYLDQMSLPVAIRLSGLAWNELKEVQHFILGGSVRGKPLPDGLPISVVHYRKWDLLKEVGLAETAYSGLRSLVGTSRVNRIFSAIPPAGVPLVGPDGFPPDLPPDLPPVPAEPQEPAHAPAPVFGPDPSKARMAAVTMVRGGDHALLARWVEYYGKLIGRENLYVLRHGQDAEFDRIAAGANIVHQPDTGDPSGFDRRWATLAHFTSGLTLYYNWVLCTDVDEIVAPDPETGLALPDYLDATFATGRAPQVIAPIGVEMVPTPATGQDPLDPSHPILATSRTFRLDAGLAKPCITRRRIGFAPDGQGSTVRDVLLDPKLFLFNLRPLFGDPVAPRTEGPVSEQVEFPEFVAALTKGRVQADHGHWVMPDLHSPELYRLPARFAQLF